MFKLDEILIQATKNIPAKIAFSLPGFGSVNIWAYYTISVTYTSRRKSFVLDESSTEE
jgi:hypothetical protein